MRFRYEDEGPAKAVLAAPSGRQEDEVRVRRGYAQVPRILRRCFADGLRVDRLRRVGQLILQGAFPVGENRDEAIKLGEALPFGLDAPLARDEGKAAMLAHAVQDLEERVNLLAPKRARS